MNPRGLVGVSAKLAARGLVAASAPRVALGLGRSDCRCAPVPDRSARHLLRRRPGPRRQLLRNPPHPVAGTDPPDPVPGALTPHLAGHPQPAVRTVVTARRFDSPPPESPSGVLPRVAVRSVRADHLDARSHPSDTTNHFRGRRAVQRVARALLAACRTSMWFAASGPRSPDGYAARSASTLMPSFISSGGR